jgi:sugar fermentation stimulation protein A
MIFKEVLYEGKFLKRYKRFFADIEFHGETLQAHVPNTGSLKSCLYEGSTCVFTKNENPLRKLKATLQLLQTPTSWVGVNTQMANDLVWEVWEQKMNKEWEAYKFGKREFKISKETRFDMAFSKSDFKISSDSKNKSKSSWVPEDPCHFVEVKNVTYAENNTALFPDAITTRGQKHLEELMKLIDLGHTCELVFVIQRTDCEQFSPAKHIDSVYSDLLKKAANYGVKITPWTCKMSPQEIKIESVKKLPLIF